MARGWESKSVESQMEAAEERRVTASAGRAQPPEELKRLSELAQLELSRTRVLHDLEQVTNDRYRAQLKAALDYLDAKLRSGSV